MLTCSFENMLQSIENANYLLNTEPMQTGSTRNFYDSLHSEKQVNPNDYKVSLLNINILKPLQIFH